MKRKVTQVTKISKTVDNRLKTLEKKLEVIEGHIDLLEKVILKKLLGNGYENKSTVTYTIKKRVKNQ